VLETLSDRREAQGASAAEAWGKALHQCLNRFSAEHRELLLAPHCSTSTVVDLAERRNKTVNSLYKMLGRLRAQLAECVRLRISAEAK
jgi:hypothetical protein